MRNGTATILSSGRHVPVEIDRHAGVFFILRPMQGRVDSFWRANGYVPVCGPFALDDPCFHLEEERHES